MAATPRVICVGTGNTAELVVHSGFLLNLVDQGTCSYDLQGCFNSVYSIFRSIAQYFQASL